MLYDRVQIRALVIYINFCRVIITIKCEMLVMHDDVSGKYQRKDYPVD